MLFVYRVPKALEPDPFRRRIQLATVPTEHMGGSKGLSFRVEVWLIHPSGKTEGVVNPKFVAIVAMESVPFDLTAPEAKIIRGFNSTGQVCYRCQR